MPLPAPAGAAANNAKLVVTLILCSPLPPMAGAQGTGTLRQADACKTDLSPGIVPGLLMLPAQAVEPGILV